MSKSLGNLVFIKDALKQHSADALRWYLLSFPYRDDFEYVRSDVSLAEERVERLKAALAVQSDSKGDPLNPEPFAQAYFAALDDDLDTPKALTQISTLSAAILEAAASGYNVTDAQSALREMARVFGFWAAT